MTDVQDATPVVKRDLINQNIEKVFPRPSEVKIGERGSITFSTMGEVIEAAKMMSMSGPAIPPWLQGNPGGCWAVLMQASHWGMDPIAVARMSYEVNNQITYQSQLIHALVEARAPLQRRLKFSYAGEGQERTCTVLGYIRGEAEPLPYTSPPLGRITPKKSPLWATDPDQQLAYYSARAWSRRYCPDILLGVYADDEERPGDIARDVTPTTAVTDLHDRLAAAQVEAAAAGESREGFEEGLENGPKEGEAAEARQGAQKAAGATPTKGKAENATGGHARGGKAAPKTTAKAAKPPPLPKTPPEYVKWVRNWVRDYDTEEEIEQRWKSEMKLRNQAGVDSEVKASARVHLDQRISEIRQGG